MDKPDISHCLKRKRLQIQRPCVRTQPAVRQEPDRNPMKAKIDIATYTPNNGESNGKEDGQLNGSWDYIGGSIGIRYSWGGTSNKDHSILRFLLGLPI